jgi:hypothetical protein
MTQEEIFFPELSSDETNAINSLARQAVRFVQYDTPTVKQEVLIEQPMVQALLRFVEQQVVKSFKNHQLHCHEKMWPEYQHKSSWSIDEAASLAAGIDPLYFELYPSRYPPLWSAQREAIHTQILRAIECGKLPSTCEDGHDYVTPEDVCYFALEANLVHEWATSFFEDMSFRP